MKWTRVHDFVAYTAIGVALVLALIWAPEHLGRAANRNIKWVGLAGTTLVLFGYAARDHWPPRRRGAFCLVLLALLVVHVVCFSILLVRVAAWKILWFVFAYPVEIAVIDAVLKATGNYRLAKGRTRRWHS